MSAQPRSGRKRLRAQPQSGPHEVRLARGGDRATFLQSPAGRRLRARARFQRGASLIEGLVAMVIFSFAVLGIIGLQATMMRHNANAQIRARASFHAEQLLGLAVADPLRVGCYTVGKPGACDSRLASAMVADWRESVLNDLPGASAHEPAATYDPATRRFRLVLQWQREHEEVLNNLVVETVVRQP